MVRVAMDAGVAATIDRTAGVANAANAVNAVNAASVVSAAAAAAAISADARMKVAIAAVPVPNSPLKGKHRASRSNSSNASRNSSAGHSLVRTALVAMLSPGTPRPRRMRR